MHHPPSNYLGADHNWMMTEAETIFAQDGEYFSAAVSAVPASIPWIILHATLPVYRDARTMR
jgi:hypothetical protein